MNKEEVEMNVADLKRKVDSYAAAGRVIVYVGDLKWAIEASPAVSHLISEIGKLVAWYSASSMKVWLMATACYQTYAKCQMKQPPLDALWGLQPLSVPSGGLGLTLTSGSESRIAFSENSSPVKEEGGDEVLKCCQECRMDYEKEASLMMPIHQRSYFDKEHLPTWLKPHAKDDLDQLRRKYNRQCQNLHQSHHYLSKSALFGGGSETISFAYPGVRAGASTLPRFRRQQSCHIEFSFSDGPIKRGAGEQPNLDSLKRMEDAEVKITLALGSSCIDETKHDRDRLRDLLRENLPWQLEAIPLIVEALIDHNKFVVFHGNDGVGKRRVALAAAEAVFGSSDRLLITKARSGEGRERLERALRDRDGKAVVLVEDAEFADPELIKFLSDGFESNRDSIFILATDGDTNAALASYVVRMRLECTFPHQKRKAEWESGGGRGKRTKNETDEASSNGLDLNVRADEDVIGDLSPISSDLTIEPPHTSLALLNKIKKRVALNRGPEQGREAREALVAEFERAYNEAGSGNGFFEVEEGVLEHVLGGMGMYLNSLFGKWLKEIFQTSLDGIGEREKVSVRLCLVGEGEKEKDGFKGTCLPKRIPVSYIG